MILLSAGLIVAALVSGLLLQTWDDMDNVIEDRGKDGMEDVRTRGSLVSDPMNISWDNTHHNATIYIQNSGDTFLEKRTVGGFLNGTSLTALPAEPTQFGSQETLRSSTSRILQQHSHSPVAMTFF